MCNPRFKTPYVNFVFMASPLTTVLSFNHLLHKLASLNSTVLTRKCHLIAGPFSFSSQSVQLRSSRSTTRHSIRSQMS